MKWRELYHGASCCQSPREAATARREFEKDIWAQRERAAQVIRPFFRRYGRLQLAQILLDEDAVIAGKIAAEEYARLLDMASWHLRRCGLKREKGAAENLIDELANRGYVRLEDKAELQRILYTRRRVHGCSTCTARWAMKENGQWRRVGENYHMLFHCDVEKVSRAHGEGLITARRHPHWKSGEPCSYS